jgi:PKD repeat protein
VIDEIRPIRPIGPRAQDSPDGAVREAVDGSVRSSYVPAPVRRPRGRRHAKEETMSDQINPRARRPWRLVGAAVFALTVPAACLAVSATPAFAIGAGCDLPASITISGPHGDSTTQPAGEPVGLTLVDRFGGAPGCLSSNDVFYDWRAVWTGTGPGSDTVTVSSDAPGAVTYSAHIFEYFQRADDSSPTEVDEGTLSVTIDYVDGAPTGTTITTPSTQTAGQLIQFTAAVANVYPVTGWAWTFGDGTSTSTTGSDATVPHTYAVPGTYTVTATVTDAKGHTGTATEDVHAYSALVPRFSVSSATASPGQAITFDGRPTTTDPSATITDWSWDLGDGTRAVGPTFVYAYSALGTFDVTETVTDTLGRTSSVVHQVSVGSPVAHAPVARFTAPTATVGAAAPFDGTASSDQDGTIAGYHWDFGDGQTSDAATPTHAWTGTGTFPVVLTVTDDDGLTGSITHDVTVTDTPAPTAAFTVRPSAPAVGSAVVFDGTGSSASGGTPTYAWSFGDGGTGSGATPAHTFRSAGTFPVTLTVTDARGREARVTHSVTAAYPAADLAVAVGGRTPRAGQYSYTVTIRNLGPAAAHSVVLLNTLDGTQRLAAKPTVPTGMTCAGVPVGSTGTLTCKAKPGTTLARGKSWVLTFTVRQPTAPKVRTVSETSQVSAANPDPITPNNVASLATVLAVKH